MPNQTVTEYLLSLDGTPEELDPNIRHLVLALNKIPGVETFSSCEGRPHGSTDSSIIRGGHVAFTWGDVIIPPWAERLLRAAENLDPTLCLGCIRVRVAADLHFDCAELKEWYWWIEMEPREDYGPNCKRDMIIVWDSLAREAEKIAAEALGDLTNR